MMLNFIQRLNRVREDPDIWPNVIPGVSVRMFLDEINTLINGF